MNRLLTVISCLVVAQSPAAAQSFTPVTGDPVVSEGRYSEGASWGDINNDGHLDVFVPDLFSETNRLFVNNGDGTFSSITTGPVVTDASPSPGGVFGDIDNDGDLDLFVASYFGAGGRLYLNTGDGTFTNTTAGDIASDAGWSFGTSIADYDNDGFLDLFVTNIGENESREDNVLYRNQGDGTFARITEGDIVQDGGASAGSSWADYDNDGDLDLFVPNGGLFTPVLAEHFVYRNNSDGTFTSIAPDAIGIDPSWGGFGNWADYDNDGDFDLFVTNFGGDDNMLYTNNGDGTFSRVTTGILVTDGGDSVSSAWGDFDNDGDLDVFVTNDFNENNALYENAGNGTFAKVTTGDIVNDGGRSNGASWIDVDSDGFLDLFVPNGQRPVVQNNVLYRNSGNSNRWLNIACVGTTSNRSAIGTKVRVKATVGGISTWQLRQVSGSSGFNAQESFNLEFGLGDATQVDSLVIEWPSGLRESYLDIAPNAFYVVTEGDGIQPVSTSPEGPNEGRLISLNQNQPNPFSQSTVISYTVDAPGHVTLTVYDRLGRNLTTLVDGPQPAGMQALEWDGRDARGHEVPGGLYLYQLRVDGEAVTKGMLVAR